MKIEETDIKIEKGRLIPGFEEEGIPFFIIKRGGHPPIAEYSADYCADCGKEVDDRRQILYINEETRANMEHYRRKAVCLFCYNQNYVLPPCERFVPDSKAGFKTLGEVLNSVETLHSGYVPKKTDVIEAKEEVLNRFFDYFNRLAYVEEGSGKIFVSILGRDVEIDNEHVEGEDSFMEIGAYVPDYKKENNVEEVKEINIRIDRVLGDGFSMICDDNEQYEEYLIEENRTCKDCGKPVDIFIEILPGKMKGESSEEAIARRYRICSKCYENDKYKPLKKKGGRSQLHNS